MRSRSLAAVQHATHSMCGRLGEHVHRPHAAKRVAGLDELGGVGSQRGRVAGHVDDPAGRGLDDPAHDLLRQACPRAGPPPADPAGRPSATSSRIARRTSPAKKRAFSISLRLAFSIASAIASSTISSPHTSAARGATAARSSRFRSTGRRHGRTPRAPRTRPPGIEPLGHLGVGLQKRMGRDAQPHRPTSSSRYSPASSSVTPPWVTSATLSTWVQRKLVLASREPPASASRSSSPGPVTTRAWN